MVKLQDAILLVFVFVAQLQSCVGNHFDPHVYPQRGPFFEGWYIRIVDFDKQESYAAIFGDVLPQDTNAARNPVYLGVLHGQRGSTKPMLALEAFPERNEVAVEAKGERVLVNPDDATPPDFSWVVDGKANLTVHPDFSYLDFNVEGVSFQAVIEGSVPWGPEGEGPAGWLQRFPLPLNWFVYSISSKVQSYSWHNENTGDKAIFLGEKQGGKDRQVYAHMEKNWGVSFPEKWIWSEGLSPDGRKSFVITHGPVDVTGLGLFSMTGFLIGYRNMDKGLVVNFKNVDSISDLKDDGCTGDIVLTVTSIWYKAEFKVSADPASFSKCFPGPEANGFRHVCSESFVAEGRVKVWERHGLMSWELVDEATFTLAALEFGGKYTCKEVCAGGDHSYEGGNSNFQTEL